MGWDHHSWSCLEVWRTKRQKTASVSSSSLLCDTRAQALSLVLRRKKMLLLNEVVWSSWFLLPLFSPLSGSFLLFHFHEKQQTLILGFLSCWLLWLLFSLALVTMTLSHWHYRHCYAAQKTKVGSSKHLGQPESHPEVKVNRNKILQPLENPVNKHVYRLTC